MSGILIPLCSLAVGFCTAAVGVMLGLGLCELGFEMGLIRANADIDDDAMIITMGWAMAGGLTGLLSGTVFGWRTMTKGKL